ncbi:Glycerol ABC transporter subunit A, ATP-binding component [Mycoplasma yeatsii 13926]|uniref:Glycerol ABC transporter subunit A, ATP-binding component n=1 Tax=Mycoplasma yeatsii 13926 TaxID=1188240 RepID=S6G7U9_9MOLU|nr:ABC transporter ATP-binding protein [Mycoplasma yeatsii]EOA06949.1 Glycerol ABC transporter subunit A, ATP-binding component [Mycoplasma yeatsii 13926]
MKSEPKNEHLITIKNLIFKYSKKQKFDDVNIGELTINKNEIICLLGPSGSGKTTLLNLILGFIKPTSGEIKIKNNPSIHEVSYIMQENSVYENTTVFNNVYLSAKNYDKWVNSVRVEFFKNYINKNNLNDKKIIKLFDDYKKSIHSFNKSKIKLNYLKLIFSFLFNKNVKNKFKFLKEVKLKNLFKIEIEKIAKKLDIDQLLYKNVNELSGGQKQRVAFAKGIIKKTNLILMDEPFSALDAKIKESTIQWLIKIKREFNLSLIIVTHDQQDALKISDQIILLNKGRVQQYSSGNEMYDNPNNLFVAKFIGYPEINYIGIKDDKHYYIRHNKIEIQPDMNGKYKIIDCKNLGDKTLYTIDYSNDNNWSVLDSQNNIEIGSSINMKYSNNDVLIFDDKGNRVYE